MTNIRIKKLNKNAIIPQYKTKGSAGFDISVLIENTITIKPMDQKVIPTGLAFAIPNGFEMQIRSRSGLSAKNRITISNSPGTIDSDYRGEILLIVQNDSNNDFVINNGDRIAQGIIKEVPQVKLIEVNELDDTERADGGFGSTGIS